MATEIQALHTNKGTNDDFDGDEKKNECKTEPLNCKTGDIIDSLHPDSNQRWINATIIESTLEQIQLHYSGIGTEEIIDIDDYVPDSDEDDWIDRDSHVIAPLNTHTYNPMQLPNYHIPRDDEYHSSEYINLVFLQDLDLILFPGWKCINCYNIKTNEYSEFVSNPHDDHFNKVRQPSGVRIGSDKTVLVLDENRYILHVVDDDVFYSLDINNKKWFNVTEYLDHGRMNFRTLCYIPAPMDTIYAYKGIQSCRFDTESKIWSDLGEIRTREQFNEEMNQTNDDRYTNPDGIIGYNKEYKEYDQYFREDYVVQLYNPLIKKLLWFNLFSQSIYTCDIFQVNATNDVTDEQELNSVKWSKYELELPHGNAEDCCCLVPCFGGEYVFIFYFEYENNEIWVLDMVNKRLEKSEKYLNMNVGTMDTKHINMVQAGSFIQIFDFEVAEQAHLVQQYKMSILDIMPRKIIEENLFVTHGYTRKYNEGVDGYQMRVPLEITELLLKFVCVFL